MALFSIVFIGLVTIFFDDNQICWVEEITFLLDERRSLIHTWIDAARAIVKNIYNKNNLIYIVGGIFQVYYRRNV